MMSEKFRLDRKIDFQNKLHTKRINIIIDSIGPSIIFSTVKSAGSAVVECLTRDRRAVGSSLTGVTVMCP